MNWIDKIAFYRGIRNETPNKELAEELAATENREGIREISTYIYDKSKSVSSDCLSVLYTIGYTKPELIADYLDDFLSLLGSKNNRMVWGSMIALATIARLKADSLFEKLDLLLHTMKTGTLITEVWGIKALVNISLDNKKYKSRILPVLFEYLEECRPIDFAARMETVSPLIKSPEEYEIIDRIAEMKSAELSDSQIKKLRTVLSKGRK